MSNHFNQTFSFPKGKSKFGLLIERTPEEIRIDLDDIPEDSYVRTKYSENNPCDAWCKDGFFTARNKFKSGTSAVELNMKADELLDMIQKHEEFEPRYDVTGEMVDVGTFLDGTPECMIDFPLEDVQSRKVKLYFDMTVSWKVSQETIINRGAAVLALLDYFKSQNIETELIMFTNGGYRLDDGKLFNVCLSVRIDTENGYSRSMLNYMLTDPSYLRICHYGIQANSIDSKNHYGRLNEILYSKKNRPCFSDGILVDMIQDSDCKLKRNWSTTEYAIKNVKDIIAQATEVI